MFRSGLAWLGIVGSNKSRCRKFTANGLDYKSKKSTIYHTSKISTSKEKRCVGIWIDEFFLSFSGSGVSKIVGM